MNAHRLYHLIGGLFFPIFYWFVPSHKIVLIFFFIIAIIFSIIEILRFFSHSAKNFLYKKFSWLSGLFKQEEASRVSGTTYLAWGDFLTTFLFQKDIAILAMVFLAVGDLAAAVFGESFGKINILGRSLEGFIVSFIVSLIVGLIYFKYFSFINLSFKIILWGSLTSSIIGHISTPVLKINDNLTIPVISGLVMTLVL